MSKVAVYPSKRWDSTRGDYVASPELCRREYFGLPMHSQRIPDLTRPVEVEEALLDRDGCVLRSKLGAIG